MRAVLRGNQKIGIVFGVFDGLHPGHEYFLSEAQKLCNELTVALTPSETVITLKGRAPKLSFEDRRADILRFNPNIKVVPSDTYPGKWEILKKLNFETSDSMIILGYDQTAIAEELTKMKVPYITLPSHMPQKYKSSILRLEQND